MLGKLFFGETDKVVFSYKGAGENGWRKSVWSNVIFFFKFNSRFHYHAQIKVFLYNALSVKIKNLFKMFKEISNRS